MINIPRALFQSRSGRQPIYHIVIEEMQDWAHAREPPIPLKGYPGVLSDPRRKVVYRRPVSQHRSGRVVHDHFSDATVSEVHDATAARGLPPVVAPQSTFHVNRDLAGLLIASTHVNEIDRA